MKKRLLYSALLLLSSSIAFGQSVEITPQKVNTKATGLDQILIQSTTTPSLVGLRHGGTFGSPTAVINGARLLTLEAKGHNGTSFTNEKASIQMNASESWTSTANGIFMSFSTTANGSTSFLERMRIAHDGNIGIGTTNPLAKLQIDHNSSISDPTLSLVESSTLDGSRLAFKNSNSTQFQLYGNPGNDDVSSLFNFYHSTGGNVMQIRGDGRVAIGANTPDFPLHVQSTAFMNSSSTGAFAIGPTTGSHLNFDGNEINAWSGTSGSTLYLNFWSNSKVQIGNGSTGNLDVNGFSNLGDGAPAIKMKKFSGSIPLNATSHTIAHGLTKTKILGLQIFVESSVTGNRYLPNDGAVGTSTHYEIQLDNTNIVFQNIGVNLDNEPYIIVVTYEQ